MVCHLGVSRKCGKVLQKPRLGCNYGAWSVLELAHRLKPHLPLGCRNMAGRSSTGKNRKPKPQKSKQTNTFPNQISAKNIKNSGKLRDSGIFIFPKTPSLQPRRGVYCCTYCPSGPSCILLENARSMSSIDLQT